MKKPSTEQKRVSLFADVDFSFTVMLIGDSCCGKTCLLIRFKDGAFLNNNFISTVGIDYRNKLVEVDNAKIKLQGSRDLPGFIARQVIHPEFKCTTIRFESAGQFQIWDTAGQERFRSVTSAYYRDADALLLVYDISNRNSFTNIRNWLAQVKEFAKDSVLITLIGNKMDLHQQRKVKYDEGKKLAEDYNIAFIETSAKTGQNVHEAFQEMARRLIRAYSGIGDDGKAVIDLATHPSSSFSCCSTS